MLIEALLAVVIFLLIITIALLIRGKKIQIESTAIETAVSKTWINLGLDKKIGAVESHVKDIRDSYRDFEQLLRVPTERSSFGEMTLETIFSDQLPKDIYGIREKTLDGKIPDAHIKSTVGTICIDSKFPLENYKKMIDSIDINEKESHKKQFIKDVKRHLDKIAVDYVCPEKGSAEFAFAYIPSEGVYYFLISEEPEMLREYTKNGVQLVSPLTLSSKIELIKAGVLAKKLTEEAYKIRNTLLELSNRFEDVDEIWRVFYTNHFKNLDVKARELDIAYSRLREEFDKISKFSKE